MKKKKEKAVLTNRDLCVTCDLLLLLFRFCYVVFSGFFGLLWTSIFIIFRFFQRSSIKSHRFRFGFFVYLCSYSILNPLLSLYHSLALYEKWQNTMFSQSIQRRQIKIKNKLVNWTKNSFLFLSPFFQLSCI